MTFFLRATRRNLLLMKLTFIDKNDSANRQVFTCLVRLKINSDCSKYCKIEYLYLPISSGGSAAWLTHLDPVAFIASSFPDTILAMRKKDSVICAPKRERNKMSLRSNDWYHALIEQLN